MKRLLSLLAVVLFVPAVFAATQTFTATLTPSGNGNGFGNVLFNMSNGQATLKSVTNGLGTITGISLYSNGQLVQTFTDPNNQFRFGQFARAMALDPSLAAQIAANPQNYQFVITTTDQPLGAIRGNLNDANTQSVSGTLSGSGSNSNGSFVLSFTPVAGGTQQRMDFDIDTTGIGNNISSASLAMAGTSPLVTFANNSTATGGRITGSTTVTAAQAQQILANPSQFGLTVAGANASTSGTLGTANEIFIPVVGNVHGGNNTNFVTDLNVFNTGVPASGSNAMPSPLMLQLFQSGQPNAQAQQVANVTVAPQALLNSRAFTSGYFPGLNGIGAMRIVTNGSVFANARIYNDQTSNGQGTFGQFVPGMTRTQALMQGVLVGLSDTRQSVPAGVPSARTNIGLFNPNNTPVTVMLELRNPTGTVVATRTLTLGAYELDQLPLSTLSGVFNSVTTDTTAATVDFIAGAPVFVYGSVIDNTSGDATFVTPVDTSIQ